MSDPDDVWMTRKQVAQALTDAGYPTSASTLASLASSGSGPPYRINPRLAEYQWGPTLTWRKSIITYRGNNQGENQ